MKETDNDKTICGICGAKIESYGEWIVHYCKQGIVTQLRCPNNCPLCLHGLLITYDRESNQLNLCRNPECLSYVIEEDSKDKAVRHIIFQDIKLASFSIRKNAKTRIISNFVCYNTLSFSLVNQIAEAYVKKQAN